MQLETLALMVLVGAETFAVSTAFFWSVASVGRFGELALPPSLAISSLLAIFAGLWIARMARRTAKGDALDEE